MKLAKVMCSSALGVASHFGGRQGSYAAFQGLKLAFQRKSNYYSTPAPNRSSKKIDNIFINL